MLHSFMGLLCFVMMAWLLSEQPRQVHPFRVLWSLTFLLLLAALLLKVTLVQELFGLLNHMILAVQQATRAGTGFVFGYLGGSAPPFAELAPGSSFVLAFQALPLALVISALSALLFYWRILPLVVHGFSWALRRSLGISGALSFGAAANIFLGMVEAPLLIRPYLAQMTRSELFSLMTCGMATIAGTVLVLYASLLSALIPDITGHLLIASVLSAPAAIALGQIMVPETQAIPSVETRLLPSSAGSAMEAITEGTLNGVQLLVNIVALLIVLVALVDLANQLLACLPTVDAEPLTLQRILGWVMAPVVWLMGVPWSEAPVAGALMGTKTVLNEMLAYMDLRALPPGQLSARSQLIMTYALCGFANFGSLGILIGGMSSMVPERREEIVALGMKSIVAGTLATCMTGALVGLYY